MTELSERIFHYLRNRVHRYLTPQFNQIRYTIKYGDAYPDPLNLIWVDPAKIEFIQARNFWRDKSRYSSHIIRGNWDINIRNKEVVVSPQHEGFEIRGSIPIEQFLLYTSVKHKIETDIEWEETTLYHELINNIDLYEGWNRYQSIENIKNSFQRLDYLIESMQTVGYQLQENITNNIGSVGVRYGHPRFHEIAVNIGRDGKVIFDDGRHRFVVAKALGLDTIPCRVFVRHPTWMERRQRVSEIESFDEIDQTVSKYLTHPDMECIYPHSI